MEGDKAKEKRGEEERLLDDAGLKRAQQICAKKIQQAAADGTLLPNPKLADLLAFWQAWAQPDEAQSWVRGLVESRNGLLSFLVSCMRETKSYSLGSHAVRSTWRIDIQFVERFVEPELIEAKLAAFLSENLQETERVAVEAFLKALKRKRTGKPPFPRFDDD